MKVKDDHLVSEENWLLYFQSLHSNEPVNPTQQLICNKLREHEDRKKTVSPFGLTDYRNEIRAAVKNLKLNNKTPFSDKIMNEMIKASLNNMMPVYCKLFNTILDTGTTPQTWCGGLIKPIYKSGGRSDPSNYRGICVSSCRGKLFCSTLNPRFLEHVTSHNILHKSQI